MPVTTFGLKGVAALGLVLAASGAVAGAAAMAWLGSSLPAGIERVEAVGLAARVEVRRDAHGVPHVFAASAEDAAFALGFVHAEDRLWQMESTRRLGSGRLAEILGPDALPSDRFMRTLGLYRLAEDQYARLSDEIRRTLDAYAAGVNARLASRTGALPPEFLALGFAPEPWRPADSLVWMKIMAVRLAGNRHSELLRARLAQRLPAERIALLWPPEPPDSPITLDDLAGRTRGLAFDRLEAADPPAPDALRGASNAWAIAGHRTDTGQPLLANDPHLGFSAPVVWYLARIETPRLALTGATVPGVPFVILGHNTRIAWGMTTTGADIEDLFVERVDPADPKRYLTPKGSAPFETREETIRVKGQQDAVLTVRRTRHGPVILDTAPADGRSEPDAPQRVLALAATYLRDDDRTPEAAHRVNQARGWDDFVAALRDFHAPPHNFVFADVDGGIGFLTAGRIPIRRSGRGWAPAPGWTDEADWIGFVPFEALLRATHPASGRFVNANNRVVGGTYPWYLGDGWDEGFRAERILERLDAEPQHSLASSAALQMDTVSLMARRLLPLMLSMVPKRDRHAEALGMLRAWSGEMARDRPEPLIFSAWLRDVDRALFADELGPLFSGFWAYRPRLVERALTEDQSWCDDIATEAREDCPSRLEAALDAALALMAERFGRDLRAWRWGDAHKARFDHPVFGHTPLLDRWADLTAATDGGEDTVQVGASRLDDDRAPFAAVHGAGFRAVYDLANLARSRFVIATGQSGHPLSPHYRDLFRPWRDGGLIALGQSRETLEREATGRLTLEPRR